MSSKFLSVLAGVALAASATSAFAFDAVLGAPKGLHVHPWHRSAVIEVLPATALVNVIGCRYGWCEVTAANGATGFVRSPGLLGVAVAAAPAPIVAADRVPVRVVPVVAAPVAPVAPYRTGGLFGFGLFDGFFGGAEPVVAPAPVVASY